MHPNFKHENITDCGFACVLQNVGFILRIPLVSTPHRVKGKSLCNQQDFWVYAHKEFSEHKWTEIVSKIKRSDTYSSVTHFVSNTTGLAAHWKKENSHINIANASITQLYYKTW